MKIRIQDDEIDVLDEFARSCRVMEMFRDDDEQETTEPCVIPRAIQSEIRLLNQVTMWKMLGHTVGLKLATFEMETLLRLLEVADYLDCTFKTDLARCIADRLAGKSPRDMARLLHEPYTPNVQTEYARTRWLVPRDAVPPWPWT